MSLTNITAEACGEKFARPKRFGFFVAHLNESPPRLVARSYVQAYQIMGAKDGRDWCHKMISREQMRQLPLLAELELDPKESTLQFYTKPNGEWVVIYFILKRETNLEADTERQLNFEQWGQPRVTRAEEPEVWAEVDAAIERGRQKQRLAYASAPHTRRTLLDTLFNRDGSPTDHPDMIYDVFRTTDTRTREERKAAVGGWVHRAQDLQRRIDQAWGTEATRRSMDIEALKKEIQTLETMEDATDEDREFAQTLRQTAEAHQQAMARLYKKMQIPQCTNVFSKPNVVIVRNVAAKLADEIETVSSEVRHRREDRETIMFQRMRAQAIGEGDEEPLPHEETDPDRLGEEVARLLALEGQHRRRLDVLRPKLERMFQIAVLALLTPEGKLRDNPSEICVALGILRARDWFKVMANVPPLPEVELQKWEDLGAPRAEPVWTCKSDSTVDGWHVWTSGKVLTADFSPSLKGPESRCREFFDQVHRLFSGRPPSSGPVLESFEQYQKLRQNALDEQRRVKASLQAGSLRTQAWSELMLVTGRDGSHHIVFLNVGQTLPHLSFEELVRRGRRNGWSPLTATDNARIGITEALAFIPFQPEEEEKEEEEKWFLPIRRRPRGRRSTSPEPRPKPTRSRSTSRERTP